MSSRSSSSPADGRWQRPGAWLVTVPALVVTISVLALGTSRGGPQLPLAFDWRDKLGHALAFGLVTLVYFRAARHFIIASRKSSGQFRAIVVACLGATALGATLEVIQFFLSYRTAEWLDLAADGVGAAFVGGLLLGWGRLRRAAP